MKAFVQSAIGRFEAREVPEPRPEAGEAVVRVRAALTCGTDLKLLARGHPRIALPITMGHELCGDVVEVGRGVDLSWLGARVVPGVSGPCGHCRECGNGSANLCPTGHADRTWGAFAELARIPAAVVAGNLHRVPTGLTDEAAAFLDPLASVLHGWNRLGPLAPQAKLLIVGAGALGLLWARTAALSGFRARVAGRRPERADLVQRFGGEFVEWNDGRAENGPDRDAIGGAHPADLAEAADVAIDATGDPAVWSLLPGLVRPGGSVLLFGGCAPGAAVSFDAARLHYAEISLIGSFHSTPAEAAQALAMLASGAVDPLPLLEEIGRLDDLPRFLSEQAAGRGVRFAVRPAGDGAVGRTADAAGEGMKS